MRILRTPNSRFENLSDYPFAPHYTTIQTEDGSELRIHHLAGIQERLISQMALAIFVM